MPENRLMRNLCSLSKLIFLLLGLPFCGVWSASYEHKTSSPRVVRIDDPQSIHLFQPDSERVRIMLEKALISFTDSPDIQKAWRKIVIPTDRVGIKIHTAPGGFMSTRKAIVEAVISGLEKAGVARNHIVVFDRYAPRMESSGFPMGEREDGVFVTATVPQKGYDPEVFVDLPVPGKLIWGDHEFRKDISENEDQLSTKSHISRMVTKQVDKIINIGVPIENPSFGIYGCTLSSTLSFIDNFRRFEKHPFPLDDSVHELYSHPLIKKKVVLHILDALILQFAGGPEFDPQYCWPMGSLYVSNDAIALDSLAVELMNQKRPFFEIGKIDKQISYLKTAQSKGLGLADPKLIHVIQAP